MIRNVHERRLRSTPEAAGALLDSLASGPADRLWPWELWPALVLERGLQAGARGGHGPVRYEVADYAPGRKVQFRFHPRLHMQGWHGFEVIPDGDEVVLRHTLFAFGHRSMPVPTGGPSVAAALVAVGAHPEVGARPRSRR